MNRTIAMICACLAILAIGMYRPTPGAIPLCSAEDGPGAGQDAPCVWDGARQGNGAYRVRWTLFVDGPCPATGPDTVCVDLRGVH